MESLTAVWKWLKVALKSTFNCTFLVLRIFLLIKKNDWNRKLDKKLQIVTR